MILLLAFDKGEMFTFARVSTECVRKDRTFILSSFVPSWLLLAKNDFRFKFCLWGSQHFTICFLTARKL